MMTICADKNQFAGSHGKSNAFKHTQIEKMGIEIIPTPLPFGDYCLLTDGVKETIERRGSKLKKQDLVGDIKVSVDTKKNLEEISSNICSSSHSRFRDEVILAQKVGAKLYILIENKDGIKSINDVFSYTSPRRLRWFKIQKAHENGKMLQVPLPSKIPPISGSQLAKSMLTMQAKYGVTFLFCTPEQSGAKVIELLTKGGANA